VKNKTSGETRACKQLAKGRIANLEKFTLEINIMVQMDHPNIIKLYEVYEDNRYIYLIMEECSGGELFDRILDRITNKSMFSEKEAAVIFRQMVSAICYCHAQGICHRDLKPENLLFLDSSNESPLKVIDFGLSRIFNKADNKMTTKVGTAYYVSPEVLSGDYDEKCDVWSSGVILYILLTGDPPFNGANDNEIYRKIQNKKFNFPSPQWDKISEDVKDLIKKMLCDPKDRFTAEQVLNHTWVKNCAPNSEGSLLNLNTESLKKYKNTNKLQKAVLTFIASRLQDSEIKILRDIFITLDNNQDGTLTVDEIKEGVSKLKDVKLDVEEIFSSIDTDGSGVINYTEFLAATIDQKVYLKEERLYEAFKAFDKDGSGKISTDEIKNVMQTDDESKILELIKTFDTNGDGEIDYNEFISMMSKVQL
jgi:calcium-dependent protein kinase